MKSTQLSKLNIVPEEYDAEHYQKVDYTSVHSEMADSERRFVSGLIRYYEPSNIIEMGVSRGGGTVNILNAINDFDSKCVSIDISDTCGGGDEPIACEVDIGSLGVDSNKWKLITNHDPVDIIEELNIKFDFAVIDTAHLHPVESLNFLTLLPFLNDGAIVCLHDTIDFCTTSNSLFANRILAMCVCAEKIEPKTAGNVAVNGMDLPNMVAFQITQHTRYYIRGIFDSLILPWEMIPDRLEALASFFSRHYSNDLCSIFNSAVELQRKLQFITLIGGLSLSYPPNFVAFTSWRDLRKNIVFYGAGDEMMKLLQIIEDYGIPFDLPIWDINAAKIRTINGHKVEAPNFNKNVTDKTKLCVMIKSADIYEQVKRQMSPLGYEVFHGIRALIDSVRAEYAGK